MNSELMDSLNSSYSIIQSPDAGYPVDIIHNNPILKKQMCLLTFNNVAKDQGLIMIKLYQIGAYGVHVTIV